MENTSSNKGKNRGDIEMNDNTIDNLTSAICALIEALGMNAENDIRKQSNQSIAYAEQSFLDLIRKHNLTGF
jgi:hypothetical protein